MTLFSDNCSLYYDVARVAVYGTASVPGTEDERCSVSIPTINSCQRVRMEYPDDVTDKMAREEVVKGLVEKGCPSIPEDASVIDMKYRLTQYSNSDREFSPEELLETGNVGNCSKVRNDVNDVSHTITASCVSFGEVTQLKDMQGKDTNRKMKSGSLKASATLGICDLREEAMPQAMEDLRNLAAHHLRNRDKNAYDIDPRDLECTFSMHPRG